VAGFAIQARRDLLGRERVVAYASNKLLARVQLYSVIKLETYAVIISLTKFNHYLHGRHIELQRDHKPVLCGYMDESQFQIITLELNLEQV
jgi:RNase H-like domain found in reverse transcriptase